MHDFAKYNLTEGMKKTKRIIAGVILYVYIRFPYTHHTNAYAINSTALGCLAFQSFILLNKNSERTGKQT